MDTTDPKRSDEVTMPGRIGSLSPAKVELLARRLMESRDRRVQRIPRRAANGEPVPLSFAQERLWFLDQFEAGRPALNMFCAHRLYRDFTVAVLDQTFAEMKRRHDVLRTTFVVVEGQPLQVVAASRQIPVPIVDLRDLSRAQQESLTPQLVLEEDSRFIDLGREPSLQHKLLLLSEEDAVLLEKSHHIAFDARAWQVYVDERAAFQTAFSRGVPSLLPELEIQYADYSIWQRQLLQGELIGAQMDYWTRQLADSPPLLELPTDHPRRAGSVHLEQAVAILDGLLCHSLRELSKSEGCTMFMTLLAAFSMLLSRYTGQNDFCIGTLISNRTRSETEKLIGFFLNTLVLRADLSGAPTFRELTRRIRRSTLDAYANSDVPYEKLLESFGPGRDSGFATLFRVMFGLADILQTPIRGDNADDIPDRTGESIPPPLDLDTQAPEINAAQEWVDIDLAMSINDLGNKVVAKLEYNSNLFDLHTMVRLLRHFVSLVQAAVSDPDCPIRDLPYLDDAEHHDLILEFNDTSTKPGASDCLPELFAAQVWSTPDAVSVISNDGHVTYQELNDRAHRLAGRLREAGIGPESLVALFSERGVGFLSAMLAVFEAGGAYLPLAPSDPAVRLHQIIVQGRPDLILVQTETPSSLSQAIERVSYDERSPILSIEQCLNEDKPDKPAHAEEAATGRLAYVIFTSGSTGAPKGAMVERAGMVNHLRAKIVDLKLTNSDVIAQTASQTFDISVWQFLAGPVSGGCVRIVDTEVMRDASQLLNLVERDRITILEIVPSLLLAVVDHCESTSPRPSLSSLRWMLVTGEALPPELCRKWFRLFPHIPLLNAYGPTECSDDVTHYRIYGNPSVETMQMSIGRPIVNTQLYVLDRSGSVVPAGVPGELLVGGTGVGRGYLRNPERTAESFVPNPFCSESGARLYRTGDLARYQPASGLQFLGRIDHQVKIRGFRIELSEIQSVLLRHPAVHEAIVLAREEGGEKRLTAYVVPHEQPGPAPSELRDYLQEQLPDYMVPSAFVLISKMPLNSNGKVDRRALPAPDQSDLVSGSKFVEPDGAIEKRLAEIWRGVLKLEQVGAYDNFFHLGGHSLMAIQIIHRINQAFDVNLTVRAIFDEPTITGLALAIEEALISRLEEESEQETRERLNI